MGARGFWSKMSHFAGVVFLAVAHSAYTSVAVADIADGLAYAALERISHKVRYDPAYVILNYPGGDVPADRGVCTDVVVRSYRRLGIDLQRLVHLDMKSNFGVYPNLKKWGLSQPDPNIDHRRVLNLQTFFSRHGRSLPVTNRAKDYRPGDLVVTTVPPNMPHIAIVSNRKSADRKRYMIVHNIGRGPKLEDRLFDFPITGHYRFGRKRDVSFSTTRLRASSDYFLFADDSL